MAVHQPKWDKYETALLIEAYWKIKTTPSQRIDIAAALSSTLRDRASFAIDATFRNVNGMIMSLAKIDYLFSDGTSGLENNSEIFREMAELYLNNRAEFDKILAEAKGINPETSDPREQFCEWLKENTPEIKPEDVCKLLTIAEEFCKKRGVLKNPLFEMTDVDTLNNCVYLVTNDIIFRLRKSEQHTEIVNAVNLYYKFVQYFAKTPLPAEEENILEKLPSEGNGQEDSQTDDNIVSFHEKRDYSDTKPLWYKYKNQIIGNVSSWTDLYTSLMKQLAKEHPTTFVSGMSLLSGGKIDIAKSSDINKLRRYSQLTGDLYIEEDISTNGLLERLVRAASWVGLTEKDIEIHYIKLYDTGKSYAASKDTNSSDRSISVDQKTSQSNVPSEKTPNYSNTKPLWFRYKKYHQVPVKSWSELYVLLMRQLAKEYETEFFAYMSILNGSGIDIVRNNSSYLLSRPVKLTSDLSIDINRSPQGFMKRIEAIANRVGLTDKDIEIRYIELNEKDDEKDIVSTDDQDKPSETVKYTSKVEENRTPFIVTQDYTDTKPIWFRYKYQDAVYVNSWSKLYTLVMRQLAKDYPNVFVADLSFLNGDHVDIARVSESSKLRAFSELTDDLLIEINHSANGLMKRIAVAASMVGLTDKDIEIQYDKKRVTHISHTMGIEDNSDIGQIATSFNIADDYTNMEPQWFRYKDHDVVYVNKWAQLYVSLMRKLNEDYPGVLTAGISILSGSDKFDILMSSESDKLRRSAQLTDDLVIETNLSANGLMKRIAIVASKVGLTDKDIEINYIKKDINDPVTLDGLNDNPLEDANTATKILIHNFKRLGLDNEYAKILSSLIVYGSQSFSRIKFNTHNQSKSGIILENVLDKLCDDGIITKYVAFNASKGRQSLKYKLDKSLDEIYNQLNEKNRELVRKFTETYYEIDKLINDPLVITRLQYYLRFSEDPQSKKIVPDIIQKITFLGFTEEVSYLLINLECYTNLDAENVAMILHTDRQSTRFKTITRELRSSEFVMETPIKNHSYCNYSLYKPLSEILLDYTLYHCQQIDQSLKEIKVIFDQINENPNLYTKTSDNNETFVYSDDLDEIPIAEDIFIKQVSEYTLSYSKKEDGSILFTMKSPLPQNIRAYVHSVLPYGSQNPNNPHSNDYRIILNNKTSSKQYLDPSEGFLTIVGYEPSLEVFIFWNAYLHRLYDISKNRRYLFVSASALYSGMINGIFEQTIHSKKNLPDEHIIVVSLENVAKGIEKEYELYINDLLSS